LGRKKTSILLLFLFYGILTISYATEYSIFEKDHKKGLKDQRGKELIPPEYDDLGWSDGTGKVIDGIIGYKMEDQWGIINVNNTKVSSARFSYLVPFNKNNIIAAIPDSYKLNNLYGLINRTGKIIIDLKYNSLKKFGDNLVCSKKLNNNIHYGLITQKDELIVPFHYISAKILVPQILALKDPDQLLNLVNQSGESILDIKIDDAELFADKFLIISLNGKRGLIDLNGKTIAPVKYQQFHINENRILNALPIKNWDILTKDGQLKSSLNYDQVIPIDSGFYKAKSLDYAFIINDRGEEIFRITNSGITFLNDSLALINSKNRYGVINYIGDTIIQPVYDSIKISGNRIFLYSKKTNHTGWKIADLFGILLSNQEFEAIYHLDDYNLAFKNNGFWGIIDIYGSVKIFAKYDSIYSKMNDLYLVDFYGEKGVIDGFGKWKVYPQKGEVYLLKNGNYLISSYFQSRVISKWGNDLFISENYLWPFDGGYIEEDFENNFGLLDMNFNQTLPVEFS
jgi:hypothetical protein